MSQLVARPAYRVILYRRLIAAQEFIVRRRAPRPGVFFQYPPFQSPAEERVNGLTHGVAALMSLAAGVWLIAAAIRQGEALMVAGCAAYCASLTAVLSMSTLSHIVGPPRLRQLFRALDQAAIYPLTAASFTPYFIRFLIPHGWGWLLVALWGIALGGGVRKAPRKPGEFGLDRGVSAFGVVAGTGRPAAPQCDAARLCGAGDFGRRVLHARDRVPGLG